MEHRKSVKRKIVYLKSYYEAWPADIVSQVEETLLLYKRKYRYVKFGITTDFRKQYDIHQRQDAIQWQRMSIKFRTDNFVLAKEFCDSITDKEDWTYNSIVYPESIFDERKSYYVYFLVGKRRKSKTLWQQSQYTFIELFAGIGGFYQALTSVGARCVLASEADEKCRKTYQANYGKESPQLFVEEEKYFPREIKNIHPEEIPDFDICCAKFPCESFSLAGRRLGFEDTRGTSFFDIVRIIRAKKEQGHAPKVLLLENVKGLKSHDKGRTLQVILHTLDELGYQTKWKILNARTFGIPQNRDHLVIVGWDREQLPEGDFQFPYGIDEYDNTIYDKSRALLDARKVYLGDVFEADSSIEPRLTISDRSWKGHQERKQRNLAQGKGFGYCLFRPDATHCSTLSARYWRDGSEILIDQSPRNPRRLSPAEAGRLQGFNVEGKTWEHPHSALTTHEQSPFRIVVSASDAYAQFGDSVAIPVIKRIAQEIIKQLLY